VIGARGQQFRNAASGRVSLHARQQLLPGHKLPNIIARSGPDTLLVEQDGTAVSVEFEPGTDAVWLVGYPLAVGSYLARGYWSKPGHITTGRWSAALQAAEMAFREHAAPD
jgi:hypothetical protein